MSDGEHEEEGNPRASGEAYSPLIGSNFNMMAMVYGEDDEPTDRSGNDGLDSIFFTVNDYETLESDGVVALKNVHDSTDDENIITKDYATLADQALAALEADYVATLRLEDVSKSRGQADTDNSLIQVPTSPRIEATEEFDPPTDDEASLNMTTQPDLFPAVARETETTVDIEKVRKAVEKIQCANSKLRTNFETWDLNQKERAARESISSAQHALIPKGPLRAFLKETTKAKQITHTMSRSATIAEALVRLNILGAKVFEDTWRLNIHVIGCDEVECETDERIRNYFQPLVRWIGGQSRSPTSVHLSLVGPGIVGRDGRLVNLPSTTPFDRHQAADASCQSALYEQWLSSQTETPDIVVAFNAGIWGYSDWCATIRTLAERRLEVPLVVTAYTLQEAEDDYDVLKDEITKGLVCSKEKTDLLCIWEPEVNPFASKIDRPTQSAPERRRYRENQAWQAWRL